MARHLPTSTHIRATGFTLIELMIALVISAILLGVAVPSFTGTIKKNRVEGTIRELSGALALARTEAASRGNTVTFCRTPNPEAAFPVCVLAGVTPGATDGWAVFDDTDNDGVLDSTDSNGDGIPDTGETVIRVRDNLTTTRLSILDGGGTNMAVIPFNRHGFSNLIATFIACDNESDEQFSRALLMANTGRVTLASTSAGVALDVNGATVTCP